jgi:hypothetical protein
MAFVAPVVSCAARRQELQITGKKEQEAKLEMIEAIVLVSWRRDLSQRAGVSEARP